MGSLRQRSSWRKWTAALAVALLVVSAVFEMPAMAHQGFAGHLAPAPHRIQPVAAHSAHGDPSAHHGGHAAALPRGNADAAGAPVTNAAGDESPCSYCPLCLALAVEFSAAQPPERMPRASAAEHSPFERHSDPAVPPPRAFA